MLESSPETIGKPGRVATFDGRRGFLTHGWQGKRRFRRGATIEPAQMSTFAGYAFKRRSATRRDYPAAFRGLEPTDAFTISLCDAHFHFPLSKTVIFTFPITCSLIAYSSIAHVAELADALDSGSSE